MNVLIVQGSSEENGGGVETLVKTLCRSHIMGDVNFTVLYPTQYRTTKLKKTDEGRIRYMQVFIPFRGNRFLKILSLFLFNVIILFSSKISLEKFDIIHANGVAGSLLPLRFRHHTIFTMHGHSLDSFLKQRSILKKNELIFHFINSIISYCFELTAVRLSRITVAVSPTVREKFARISRREIHVIPNGIEKMNYSKVDRSEIEKKYNISDGSFICLWVGRNPDRKGLDTAIKSVEGSSRVHLLVAGFDKTAINESPSNVTYCGRLERDELYNLYANSDLLIFPSNYEAMSYTIIESLSFGLPVIGFRKDFMVDVVGENYPLLCDREDDFKTKILGLLRLGNEEISRLRKLSLNISKRFDADSMAVQYHKLYEELCNEK